MPHAHSHHIPSPKLLSPLGRGIASLQLIKETLTIVLLGTPLLLSRPLLLLMLLPGIVLYLFRWVMVLGAFRRRAAVVVWGFTLMDELWGWFIYMRANELPTVRQLRYLHWSYWLGFAFSIIALSEIAYRRYRDRSGLRALLKSA